jgi:hypothetical protein
MGKAERESVEKAEIIICKLLNKKTLSDTEKRHPLFGLCQKFCQTLWDDFGTKIRAQHIGNDYNTPGDIKLLVGDTREIFVEIKFLQHKGDTGTLANISLDALTDHAIIRAESRSDFMKRNGHYERVVAEMRKVPGFEKIPTGFTQTSVYDIAGQFKEIMGAGDNSVEKVAKKILIDRTSDPMRIRVARAVLNIIQFDHDERIEYINILKKASGTIDKNKLKRFTLLLLSGSHTHDAIEKGMETPIEEWLGRNNYEIYYLYKDCNNIVRNDKIALAALADCEYDIDFKNQQLNIMIYRISNGEKKNTLRLVLHWKNKFQGIQTPCLNVFQE